MKKKLLTIILAATMALSFTACSSKNETDTTEQNQVVDSATDEKDSTEKSETPDRDFPEGNYSDMGTGTFSIQTTSGSSADGSIPVVFIEEDSTLIQITYTVEAMDKSRASYIYIDGMEVAEDHLGDLAEGTLDLQDEELSIGIHTVELVQYATDEPSEELITYKMCQYEVRPDFEE